MKLYFDDEASTPSYSARLESATQGWPALGSVYAFDASRIKPGDRDSWYHEWSTFADGLETQAATAGWAGTP